MAARLELLEVVRRLGTPAAANVLNEAPLEGDTQLRFGVIAALNKLHQTHPELERDRQMIETVLAAEILGHYRSYQFLGTLGSRVDEADPVVSRLRDSMRQEVERIFRMLALLHPGVDLHSAYYGVQSENPVVHDNALDSSTTCWTRNCAGSWCRWWTARSASPNAAAARRRWWESARKTASRRSPRWCEATTRG